MVYRGFGASIPLGTLADDGTHVLFQYSPQALEHRLDGEHFMDVAGEGRAPHRAHIMEAATQAGLPSRVAQRALDEMLALASPSRLLQLARDLPRGKSTIAAVHRAVSAHHARLSKG